MMKATLLVCFALLLPLQPARAQAPPAQHVPAIVLSGLETYRSAGPDEAIRAWLKGSPIEGSKDAMAQANQLREIQDFYGNYQGFDLLGVHSIAPSTHLVYIVLNFAKGPLFGKFLTYRTGQGWVVASFSFNTNPDQVLPPALE